MCGECEERDIQRHDKRETMYYDKAGSLCIYLRNRVKFVYWTKSCLSVRHQTVVLVLGKPQFAQKLMC